MATGVWISLILYFLLMLAIGVYAWRKSTSSSEEYMLGGRNLPPAVAALSAGASDMSGWRLLGLPGALYAAGLVESWIGIGLFVSRLGHVVTNAHIVEKCWRITVGDNADNQTPAALINRDARSDLALLKLRSLETASAGSKSLIRKLGLKVVPHDIPMAAHGLLRAKDVELGEDVLVSGFPFGDIFSSSVKVTKGIVSSVRGIGDDIGQFQMDAAVQAGNSGGPVYDENGNIVGVVIAQLNKLKVAKAIGSLPENVNFGIKASTVRQFLTASGLPSKWASRSKKISTKELAGIAQKQTLMVVCHR